MSFASATKGDGKYTFLMPASRVTVSVSFAEIEPEVTVPVGVYIPVSVANLPFTDVPEYAWYANAVLYVCRNDLMNGVSTYRFAPEAVTSRGMIVTILYRLEGEPGRGHFRLHRRGPRRVVRQSGGPGPRPTAS